TGPFCEVARFGAMPLGEARLTSAGRLPFRAIIHVAGINLLWFATERSVRGSVRNAMALAGEEGFRSIAFPLIGSGSGSMSEEKALGFMQDEFGKLDCSIDATIVVLPKRK
ncbi:MAG TPA: macro domain-containing protein, partial [Armatimonadota bacterium]|nr:macro domain-containing protein [Armatimonadota bacterium]